MRGRLAKMDHTLGFSLKRMSGALTCSTYFKREPQHWIEDKTILYSFCFSFKSDGFLEATADTVSDRTKQTRLVVCITGMPGAGKSTFSEEGTKLGFEVFRMGDDVRMEAERRNVAPSDENLGKIMMELRQKGGAVAIAHLCKQRIEKDARSKFVTIDGIRNTVEFVEFKKLGLARLLAIHASPERRFKFLQARGRSDFPATWQSFESRDKREISVGVAEPIALADDIVSNSGTLEELSMRARDYFARLKQDLKF
jgi:dephospho-CoA kinase